MTDTVASPPPIIRLEGIVKTFGGARALDGAGLTVARGSVHGLVGQNGAGKSTLIKLLAGLHQPDAGRVEIDGIVRTALSPHAVEALGLHFIHQDRLLVPTFTVGEALFLGREPRLPGTPFLDRRQMQRRADEILRRYFGLTIPATTLIRDLTTAEKQIVQITRALLDDPKVLVFDEPTAALVRREAEILFRLIRRLKEDGITVLYISHYLSEIEAICDTVTVMRNGRDVATLPIAQTSAREIGALMVARDIAELYPKQPVTPGAEVLRLEGLSLSGRFEGVSLSVRAGEILGLTGLIGSGAKDLIHALFGLARPTGGRVLVRGEPVFSASPAAAAGRHLALVPEDRRRHGVALGLSVRENATLAGLKRFTRLGLIDRRAEADAVDEVIRRLQIKTAGREALVGSLSGGNQQKVAIAKWLGRDTAIYLLDEPTVGVDIAAKVEIYTLIGELAARGAAIVVLSSDLQELAGIADRVAVLFRGRLTRTFDAGEITADALLAEATGSREASRHVG